MKKLMSLKEFDEERATLFQNAVYISIIMIMFLLAIGVIGLILWSMGR